MEGINLNKKILEYYNQIDKIVEEMAGTFPLNAEIQRLQDLIKELENICDHEYDDVGYCRFCYMKKPDSTEGN